MNILFLNACVRKDSRTRILADHLIEKLKEKDGSAVICEIVLENENIGFLDGKGLEERDAAVAAGDYSSPVFDNARRLLEADVVVVAAPYWDLSFPASLKAFLESVTIDGLTFYYTEEGFPHGLCKAEKLYYLTTAGGPVVSDEYGFGYVRDLAKFYYGIGEAIQFKAEYLDVIGSDVEGIMSAAIKEIDEYFLTE